MNLNTGFFAAYNHRRQQPTVDYRLPLNNQHITVLKAQEQQLKFPM
ncbi:unnamed protein product, partial [Rotaria sp. Silwood1]